MSIKQLNITICDDEQNTCNMLEDMLDDIAYDLSMQIQCSSIHTGSELINSSILKNTDILFLDIELPDINGIELGHKINETGYNIKTLIITSVKRYSLLAYDIRPYGFILKPFNVDTIKRHLLKICKELDDNHIRFEYVLDYHTHYVNINEIMLFESNHKKIRMLLKDGTTKEFYGKLDSVISKLPDYFCRINKKYIINCRFITKRTNSDVRLINNKEIRISDAYRCGFETSVIRSMISR